MELKEMVTHTIQALRHGAIRSQKDCDDFANALERHMRPTEEQAEKLIKNIQADVDRINAKRIKIPLDAMVREWEDMETAPKNEPILLKDDNSFIYAGEYNHQYGYFGKYTWEGVVEHQHAMKWKPLPTA